MIDKVNKVAVSNMILLQSVTLKVYICSVATKLVTSLEFNPIRCATMLCHFGQTRSIYVRIPFILRGGTATSRATGDYVAVPERIGENEE